MHRNQEIDVLFIAGSGRSGSTVLDRVIGTHDGFCSVGEMRFIWEHGFGDNHLCGCGVPFHECAFWNEVSRTAFGIDVNQVDGATIIKLKESVDRIRYAPWLASSRRPAGFQLALDEYGAFVTRLYRAILHVSGANVIVDSSKDPTQGLLLTRLPGVRVHVVHLVRDPRAVAFSWQRIRQRPEIHWQKENMPIERVRTSAGRWLMHNSLTETLARSAASYYRLRYEDFLANPTAALSEVLEPYRWAIGRSVLAENSEVTLNPTHSVSGNPMRFTHGNLKLRLDDQWKKDMPIADRRLVTAITWPLLIRYGYPLQTTT